MKILLLIDCLDSGGAQRQMVGLAHLLQDRGCQIKVIYYHPIHFFRPYLDEHHIKNEYVAGAENKLRRLFLIAKAIRQYHPEVIISYLDVPNIIVCILKTMGMKFRLIVSERNTSQSLNISERLKFYCFKKANAIVPNSYTQERFIKAHYSNLQSRVHTITNFVNMDVFVPKERMVHDILRILVVGRISRQKNTLKFLQAMHILVKEGLRFSVDWYGRPDDISMKECNTYIIDHQLEDVFCFHAPQIDIISKYQISDVFCLPSLYEGFPNVICEAMSCGLPILCGDVCDNPLIVEDGKNGFMFNPNDVEDMAYKTRMMLTLSEEERRNMGFWSRKLAKEKFSKDAFVEKYLNLL